MNRIPTWAWKLALGATVLGGCAFYGLVFSVNWKIGVALAFFAVTLSVFLYSVQLAILPVFFAIAFDRLGKLGPESPLTVAKILITVLIMAWAVRILVGRDGQPLRVLARAPMFYLGALSFSLSLFSIVGVHNTDLYLAQNLRRLNNLVLMLLIITIVNSKPLLRRVFCVIIAAYFFVGLTAMFELATQESILKTVWGEEDTALEYTLQSESFRIGGPGGDPDFLAISVLFPSLVGVSLLRDPNLPRLFKAFTWVVIFLLLFALLATGSRGGLMALLIGAGILWFFTDMRHKFAVAAVAAVVLVIAIFGLSLSTGSAAAERYTGEAGGKSVQYRLGWTEMAFMMIQDHPFMGIGTGNFPDQYSRYVPRIPEIPRSPYWTHNSFLQTWAENGVLAFLVYISLFLTAAGLMLTVIRETGDPLLHRMAVLLLAAVVAYAAFAATSNVLENENYWIVFSLASVVYLLHRGILPGRDGSDPDPEPA